MFSITLADWASAQVKVGWSYAGNRVAKREELFQGSRSKHPVRVRALSRLAWA